MTSDFHCVRCGNCCRIPGEVRLLIDEPERIAKALGMTTDYFIEHYTRLTRDRLGLSIIEQEDDSCAMWGPDGCRIHEVKPYQCRAFPLEWSYEGWEAICEAAESES